MKKSMRTRTGHVRIFIVAFCLVFLSLSSGCRKKQPGSEPQARSKAPAAVAVSVAPDYAGSAERSSIKDRYVFLISIDGLGANYLDSMYEQNLLPSLNKIRLGGAWTHQARTDVYHTTTIPNHTCMITGLPSKPTTGWPKTTFHGYTYNRMPDDDMTLHNSGNPALRYIPGIFDVAHDYGLKTCLFSGKPKFVIYTRSYSEEYGAPDRVPPDNGKDKIDVYYIEPDTNKLVSGILETLSDDACRLYFIHFADPDLVGHKEGWGSPDWKSSVRKIDKLFGDILNRINEHPDMKDKTLIVLTADHGGLNRNHGNRLKKENFTVPFYLWGPGVPGNQDLYSVVTGRKKYPPDTNPEYTAAPSPVRNGDAGNFALSLLGLPPVPGSVMFNMKLKSTSVTGQKNQ